LLRFDSVFGLSVRAKAYFFGIPPMPSRNLIVLTTSLAGGAIGLFAPVGIVRWLLQTEPADAGILTLFFFPVWCLVVVSGLLIGRSVGTAVTRQKRAPQR
jgi:hypothetical protein